MNQDDFNSSYDYNFNHNHNSHLIVTSQPMTKYNCTCFHRRIILSSILQIVKNIFLFILDHNCKSSKTDQTCSTFNKHSSFETKQISCNHVSHRVTVRRITAPHIAAAAIAAYRKNQNTKCNRNHFEQFNPMATTSHNQFIPSIPFKKIIRKNDGLKTSSTSIIITADNQVILL
ncbi:unnamed protein product [Rotaria magnacalcarata]|uniref:Uncharacterized protein n=1 Tax=Rotaria magnacalcarata TaxID=392030 RepID=A0A816GPL9_9BILA|nr:unnamed protein product [Rotaria magnacalcarata]CAF1676733.1 unnamed protein product [Rotaria magnacalcarata]CAF2040843.1 unnamed protein product [Rotaria magnacalcarata]CAF4273847.1 unnamed protein product [Rotaria magnacalcarata]CAF4333999.1 unnamed protein product [Rotaria magnacalcarata]